MQYSQFKPHTEVVWCNQQTKRRSADSNLDHVGDIKACGKVLGPIKYVTAYVQSKRTVMCLQKVVYKPLLINSGSQRNRSAGLTLPYVVQASGLVLLFGTSQHHD